MSKRHFMGERPRAFTFLEIMFVVVIIGILMAVAVRRMTPQVDVARRTAARGDVSTLSLALKAYAMDVGGFPDARDGLGALLAAPTHVAPEMWRGPYLEQRKLPVDPWKQPYNYRAPGEQMVDFDVWSNGPDKQSGTNDDVGNWTS